MPRNYYRKTKDLTVAVTNPKTPEEYVKMVDILSNVII